MAKNYKIVFDELNLLPGNSIAATSDLGVIGTASSVDQTIKVNKFNTWDLREIRVGDAVADVDTDEAIEYNKYAQNTIDMTQLNNLSNGKFKTALLKASPSIPLYADLPEGTSYPNVQVQSTLKGISIHNDLDFTRIKDKVTFMPKGTNNIHITGFDTQVGVDSEIAGIKASEFTATDAETFKECEIEKLTVPNNKIYVNLTGEDCQIGEITGDKLEAIYIKDLTKTDDIFIPKSSMPLTIRRSGTVGGDIFVKDTTARLESDQVVQKAEKRTSDRTGTGNTALGIFQKARVPALYIQCPVRSPSR